MPEGLSATEVGKEMAEHREHTSAHRERDRAVSIIEAVLLSVVALLAAWSGYSAAKWGSHSSIELAKTASDRNRSSLAQIQATQIRTLDSVSFNAAATAYTSGDKRLFRLTVRRLRPGYQPAFRAWLATHPLKNPSAPPDPSAMPQYRIPQEAQARALSAAATVEFGHAQDGIDTSDKYVRVTVLLAAVLFLVGIGSRFPLRAARFGLVGVAGALLIVSIVQIAGLPGPPA